MRVVGCRSATSTALIFFLVIVIVISNKTRPFPIGGKGLAAFYSSVGTNYSSIPRAFNSALISSSSEAVGSFAAGFFSAFGVGAADSGK